MNSISFIKVREWLEKNINHAVVTTFIIISVLIGISIFYFSKVIGLVFIIQSIIAWTIMKYIRPTQHIPELNSSEDISNLEIEFFNKMAITLGVFKNQIEHSLDQGNSAVTSLSEQFENIYKELQKGINISNTTNNELAMDVFDKSRNELLTIVNSIKESMEEKNDLFDSVRKVGFLAEELNEKTKNIHKISKEINLLSFNASIEAARAGEQGKGFGVVAERVRELSTITDQASSDMSKGMDGLIAEIEKSVSKSQVLQLSDTELLSRSEEKIISVIESLENLNMLLEQLVISKNESAKKVGHDINQSILQFQFQDRVSQTLSHVVHAIVELELVLKDQGIQSSDLIDGINDRLYESYTMKEERDKHSGSNKKIEHSTAELTFF